VWRADAPPHNNPSPEGKGWKPQEKTQQNQRSKEANAKALKNPNNNEVD